ncbi:MAG: mechanosensitive ion channel, partial [Bdellovibrionales bacterium]|nr:mechanosensitive ion channel [Bdellovibrionales bacterium]
LLAVYFSKEFTKTCKTAETDNVQAKDPNVIDDNKEVIKENNKTLVILGQFGKLFQVIFSFAAFFLLLGFYRLVLFFEDTLFNALYLGLILFVVYKLCFGFGVFFIQIPYAQHIRVIKKNTEKLIQLFNRLLIFCAVVFWLYRGMFALGIDKSVINGIKSFLASGIEIGDLNIQVGGIILAVFFLLAGGKISLGIRAILEEEFYARKQLDPGTRNTLDTGIHYVVLILSVLAAVGSLGIGLQNIAIIAGALSVGIGFGLQNIVNNFVSGIILLFERPIKVGDLILVGDNVGTVSRIGIRSSTIKTLDEAEIIIPNATLVTDKVVNWTLTNKRARMVVSVGVAYGTDLEKCSKVLLDTLKAQEFILDYPQPDVLFKSFGDSSLNFEARGWIRNVLERPDLHSRLSIAIHNAIRDAGITIPFPQRDVHIIKPAEQI